MFIFSQEMRLSELSQVLSKQAREIILPADCRKLLASMPAGMEAVIKANLRVVQQSTKQPPSVIQNSHFILTATLDKQICQSFP